MNRWASTASGAAWSSYASPAHQTLYLWRLRLRCTKGTRCYSTGGAVCGSRPPATTQRKNALAVPVRGFLPANRLQALAEGGANGVLRLALVCTAALWHREAVPAVRGGWSRWQIPSHLTCLLYYVFTKAGGKKGKIEKKAWARASSPPPWLPRPAQAFSQLSHGFDV